MEERRKTVMPELGSNLAMQIGSLVAKVDTLSTELQKVDTKVERMELAVDQISSKIDRSEGVLAVVRWLGVGGVTIAILALARSFGVHV
jgi:predicted  nucleic acid-binding Zn-ribbon protein